MHDMSEVASYGQQMDSQPKAVAETTDDVIHEALAVIDRALGQMMSRELVSSVEVTDVLLDVRSLLTPAATAASA